MCRMFLYETKMLIKTLVEDGQHYGKKDLYSTNY